MMPVLYYYSAMVPESQNDAQRAPESNSGGPKTPSATPRAAIGSTIDTHYELLWIRGNTRV